MSENPVSAILLSGGMNSAVALFYLVRLKLRPVQEAIVFNTSSPTPEWEPAKAMAKRAGVAASLWNLSLGPFMDVGPDAQPDIQLPFGGQKLVWSAMLTSAAFRARQRGYGRIVCGYLREEMQFGDDELEEKLFFEIAATACHISGMPEDLFEFPLWSMTKADVFGLAKDLGVLGEITFYTASCLEGDEETKQDSWGFGCGKCAGCERRGRAWQKYLSALA